MDGSEKNVDSSSRMMSSTGFAIITARRVRTLLTNDDYFLEVKGPGKRSWVR